MADPVNFNEILVAPIEQMVMKVCEAVAEAQLRLDRAALDTRSRIQTDPQMAALAGIGYEPTWYCLPEVVVDMKLALHYEQTGDASKARLGVAPFNAKYKNAFSYGAEGSSTMHFRIVPVPPGLAAQPSGGR